MRRTLTRISHFIDPLKIRFAGIWVALIIAVFAMTPTSGNGQGAPTPPPADPVQAKAASEAMFKLGIVGNFLDSADNQVLSLANSEFTRRYAAAYEEADRAALVSLFHAVAGANTDYMQVRFLDMHGRERVRIERPKDEGEAKPISVAPGNMQDKGGKAYFQGPKSIASGNLWHSKFNLNMEQGQIEKPIRPTFRVSTPVYIEGQFRGVVVVNLAMDRIIELLSHSSDFDVFVIDRDGEILVHPDPDKAWSRYLSNRADFTVEIRKRAQDGQAPHAFSLSDVFRNEEGLSLALIAKEHLLASRPAGASVPLSSEERAWLSENPNVRVHNETDWPPFNFAVDGAPRGFSIDYMNLLAAKVGIEIEYVTGPSWNDFMKMMKAGELDVMLNIVKTPEREKFLLYTPPYAHNPNTILSRRDTPYNSLEDLVGKTVSLPKGFFYEEILKRDFPQIKLHLVTGTLDAMKAVSSGKADAALGELAVFNHLLARHMMTDLTVSSEVKVGDTTLSLLNIATRKDLPLLASILTKGMAAITASERSEIQRKWLADSGRGSSARVLLNLSAAQSAWLAEHPTLRLGIDPAHPPFEFIADDDAYSGIAASYVKAVSRRLGVEMTPVDERSYARVLDLAKSGKIDVLPAVVRTPEREKSLAFTRTYASYPVVIATHKDMPYIGGLQELVGHRVGVLKDDFISTRLRHDHPSVKLMAQPGIAEALKALDQGWIDAYVGALPAITREITRAHLSNVKIAAPTSYKLELSMAVRKDWPELAVILDVALADIGGDEAAAIQNVWMALEVKFGTDVETIMQWALPIGGGAVIVIIAIVFWNRRLTLEIAERKKVEEKLAEAEEHARLLLASVGEGVFVVDLEGRITFVNPQAENMLGFDANEIVGQKAHPLFHHHRYDGSEYPVEECWMFKSFTFGESYRIDDEVLWRKDGQPLEVEYHSTPIMRGEDIVGAVISFIDISLRRKAEKERRDAFNVIRDSINYATHIQRSILPKPQCLEETTAEHFILWEPRDRVGGDLYWCKPWGLGKLLALGDCTGHGVPGAFMTMIANGALDMATLETMPGDVAALLQRSHQLIQEALNQNLDESVSNDGLDLGVCYIPPDGKAVTFAGAQFSLFVAADGAVSEIKGDRKGIGYRRTPHNAVFTAHEIETGEGHGYFMTSDGLTDQIGGPKRRSFGKRRFMKLLDELDNKPMRDIGDAVLRTLNEYQGDESRRDDVSVIGFKL